MSCYMKILRQNFIKGSIACAGLVLLLGCSRQEPFQRSVKLEGQSNFRDVGGYKTASGQTVKTGILYRSGELQALTDADVQMLEDLNIQTVISFLIPKEIEARGADRLPEGTRQVLLPIDSDDGLAAEVSTARKTGDFSKVPADLNPKLHEMLVDGAKEQYAALIREIIQSNGQPLAYHCSHGIHRTGSATAIILSAIGVPWDTIREDYLLSNEMRAEEIEKRTEQLRQAAAQTFGIAPAEVDMTNINAFYILQGHYIDGTLNQINGDYGGIENYLVTGLGLSPQEIEQLKQTLLE